MWATICLHQLGWAERNGEERRGGWKRGERNERQSKVSIVVGEGERTDGIDQLETKLFSGLSYKCPFWPFSSPPLTLVLGPLTSSIQCCDSVWCLQTADVVSFSCPGSSPFHWCHVPHKCHGDVTHHQQEEQGATWFVGRVDLKTLARLSSYVRQIGFRLVFFIVCPGVKSRQCLRPC